MRTGALYSPVYSVLFDAQFLIHVFIHISELLKIFSRPFGIFQSPQTVSLRYGLPCLLASFLSQYIFAHLAFYWLDVYIEVFSLQLLLNSIGFACAIQR